MAIYTDKLKSRLISNAKKSDEIIIISGYFSIDILEAIAKLGLPTTFYYGMYIKNGLSLPKYNSLKNLELLYPNFKIFIPLSYHVHTKCYIFKKNSKTINTIVGSANASSSALSTTPNSELLTPITDPVDVLFLDNYAKEIQKVSVHFSNPIITTTTKAKSLKVLAKNSKKTPKSWNNYTGNPFSAIIPLYYIKNGKPIVHDSDGLNWGNGPHASKKPEMEAILPIRKFHIDNYPTLIPFNGTVGSGTGGKIQRMQSPIDMTWDDGTSMCMVFQQCGVEVPPKSKRTTTTPYRQYPKALTTNSGGSELGVYLRTRLGLSPDAFVTYDDLRKYGRDYVTLTLTNDGNYELDFSSP